MEVLILVYQKPLIEMSGSRRLVVWKSLILEEYWPDIDGLAQRHKVTDEPMPSQTFFDIDVIHLLTTSTINRLRELYPEGRFEVRRFRPNIVVESASMEKGFIENSWVGKK